MSDLAIRAESLSKLYRIGAAQSRHTTLCDTLAAGFAAPFRRVAALLRGRAPAPLPSLWAIRDVSFEVARGEVMGVIGRNGAGKSTLLKILSRITEPTAGRAELHGRVGSLLEVGTGFHLELSGRENVYLNGAILGMRRAEIDAKFDEIVAFAEVERFIDTPVKHYSTGMHLRLAFAVAAHLEPEILLVDEVLAVGDAAFQKKCMGKMEDVASQGRTVLFVSHNLGSVRELCTTSLVLHEGMVHYRGPVVEGLARYGRIMLDMQHETPREGSGTRWRYAAVEGSAGGEIALGEPFRARGVLDVEPSCPGGKLYCIVSDPAGGVVAHQRIATEALGLRFLEAGSYDFTIAFPALWLAPGVYTVYFKFMPEGGAGEATRHLSERALLDVTGQTEGIGRATLAPAASWSVTRGTPLESANHA